MRKFVVSSNIHSSASLFLKSVSQQQFCFYSRVKKEQETPTNVEKEEGSVPTVPISKPNSIEQQVKQILAFNNDGQVAEAVEAYGKLKKMTKHIDLKTMNAIVSSFAPKRLLFKWFKPYKDYVDMYVEASKFRPKERLEEAKRVFSDIYKYHNSPDAISYNALMKVQLSTDDVLHVFDTFNELQASGIGQSPMYKEQLLTSMGTLLRACSMLEQVQLAEEIYFFALQDIIKERLGYSHEKPWTASESVSYLTFCNTMLDVYAESRDPFAFKFFEQMVANSSSAHFSNQKIDQKTRFKRSPKLLGSLNGITFNTYAKACIFMDHRMKLVEMAERMRVEGVLQSELSKPVRLEIKHALETYTQPLHKVHRAELLSEGPHDMIATDHFADLRDFLIIDVDDENAAAWGRDVDTKDFKFMKFLKPTHDMYKIDLGDSFKGLLNQ
ncbi:hypothetical protein C9374_011197 [Naegleria lovaniensis]|uniref:Uncharacterized protein n=1 Tax=Naegleria lovaniensis TaxID=51637 RepID=A0AA88KDG8_NAELO|nr:uncharacterized protein C9374_011197 [Naegleria lovaniensis]KAG2374118.1 hypothetical protein C9374_011197 [Naegleria lovaniensis]